MGDAPGKRKPNDNGDDDCRGLASLDHYGPDRGRVGPSRTRRDPTTGATESSSLLCEQTGWDTPGHSLPQRTPLDRTEQIFAANRTIYTFHTGKKHVFIENISKT